MLILIFYISDSGVTKRESDGDYGPVRYLKKSENPLQRGAKKFKWRQILFTEAQIF